MIELTVALPLWNAKHIAWLALEGLCRQEDVTFDWELIIAEEQTSNSFGENDVNKYKDRLCTAGCQRINYMSLKSWIPLAQKWRLMAVHSDSNSKVFVPQAADCFSQPKRLSEVYDYVWNQGFHWVWYPRSYFYMIPTDEVTIKGFYQSVKKNQNCKGFHYAFRTQDGRKLPNANRKRVIDKWLWQKIQKVVGKGYKWKCIESPDWNRGFNTHGFHNLSTRRYKRLLDKKRTSSGPWPKDVMKRLKELKGLARI